MLLLKTKFMLIACLIFVVAVVDSSWALPINSDLGLTPHKGELIIRAQTRYTLKSDDSETREQEIFLIPLVFVYGFTSKTSVLVSIPFFNKELRALNAPDRGDAGLGDISILGKVRIYTNNFKGGTSRLSLIAGLELPTGDDDERDSLGLLPQPLQLGSGSVDVIAGGAFTYQTLDHEFDTDLRYIFNQEANQFEFGDVFQYNFSYQKRIFPGTLPDKGIYNQWNAVLELNGIYQDRNQSLGVDIPGSGGHTLYLSPGFQFAGRRVIYEASFQYPVLQDLNGDQLETDYKLALSVRVQF